MTAADCGGTRHEVWFFSLLPLLLSPPRLGSVIVVCVLLWGFSCYFCVCDSVCVCAWLCRRGRRHQALLSPSIAKERYDFVSYPLTRMAVTGPLLVDVLGVIPASSGTQVTGGWFSCAALNRLPLPELHVHVKSLWKGLLDSFVRMCMFVS